MASIYPRGDVLWIKFKNQDGRHQCRSSGYRRGQEALARQLAIEVERQARAGRVASDPPGTPAARSPEPSPADGRAAAAAIVSLQPMRRIGPAAPADALTVAEYVEQWIQGRAGVATASDEAARLRLHVLPIIGHMAVAEVRPRHIRDLVNAVKSKTSVAPKCRGQLLAPRTVRLIFATLRLVFKSAVIDEHITASPVVVEAGVLPRNVDKDPEWREGAIFERDELLMLVTDDRIPPYRRVLYALEGIAGVRHGEAAGLRWRDYNERCQPLGKLTVSRSGTKQRTKTQLARSIPVHPTLAQILTAWRTRGWQAKYGRAPGPDDLVLPTEDHQVRKAANTLREFHRDLERIGLRARRGHDLRRTFVTLARADGGRTDVLRPLTHPGEKDIIGLYTTFPWAVVCAEVAKLQLALPGSTASEETLADKPAPTPSSYIASYSPDCSPEFLSQIETMRADSGEVQLFRKP